MDKRGGYAERCRRESQAAGRVACSSGARESAEGAALSASTTDGRQAPLRAVAPFFEAAGIRLGKGQDHAELQRVSGSRGV